MTDLRSQGGGGARPKLAVTAWAVPLWAITLPVYAIHGEGSSPQVWSGRTLDTWHEVLPVVGAGILVLPLAPWVIRGFAADPEDVRMALR